MSRLDDAGEVIELAQALGLSGKPVDSIIEFCRRRIDGWLSENGPVEMIGELEALVADRLRIVFEEFESDEELTSLIQKYVSMGDAGFASLAMEFEGETFGILTERRRVSGAARDRYVAFIDCRGEKAARRFFTRWHEIAHVLTLTRQVELPVQRSARHPLERLMDEIAGHLGFFDALFDPVVSRHHAGGRLSFAAVEAIRKDYCPKASFQATLFACQRRLATPILYIETGMGYKTSDLRKLRAQRKATSRRSRPEAKLRVQMCVPNEAAVKSKLQIVRNMRVPESSILHPLLANEDEVAEGRENLSAWRFSSGKSLPACEVWVEARRLADRAIALVQPL